MNQPTFGRLSDLYARRMQQLFAGQFWTLAQRPGWLKDDIRFYKAALTLAREMARSVADSNAKSWREAAMKSYRGKEIYAALQAELKREGLILPLEQIAIRNAELISSVPADIAQRITARAAKLRNEGKRSKEIEADIRQWAPEMAKSRIKLISRTEIGKAETDLTRIRAESIGITWAAWQTSEDQRVRPSHRNLDKVLMNWDDPPQPEALIGERSTLGSGFAGQFPNCRCLMLPVADLSEIRWPAKVFGHGRIVSMTRAQFAQQYGKIAA